MISTLFLFALLAQTDPAIRRSTPLSNDPGMVVRPLGVVPITGLDGGAIPVSGGGWAPDGGNIGIVTQGPGQDGGAWVATLSGIVDTGNSTTTPLGAGATFTGTWRDVLGYPVINISVYSDVASATGGWKMQWSSDGVNLNTTESLNVVAASGRSLAINVRARYFRVTYTNGATPQAVFRLGTVLQSSGTGINNYPLDKTIETTAMSVLTRSVITGQTTAGGGSFVNVKVTPSGALASEVTQASFPWYVAGADGGSTWSVAQTEVTAFNAARVANPHTLKDSIHQYGLDLDEWGVLPDGGSVVWQQNESSIRLTADAGQTAAIRTHENLRYQAGKGMRVLTTAVLDGLTDAGQTYRWGTFDDSDGFGWRYNATGLAFFIRSSTDGGVTDTVYPVDAGASWVPAYGSIYDFDYQWLGVGAVRVRLNGAPLLTISHANTLPWVYTKTATLPITYEATGGTGATQATMKAICSSVQSEGGEIPPALTFAERMTTEVTLAPAVASRPVLSLRPTATFNGVYNRVEVMPSRVWCSSDNRRARIDLVLNPATLTNAAFAAADTRSAAAYDTAATAFTGGTLVGSFGVGQNTSESYRLDHIFGPMLRQMNRQAYLTSAGAATLDPALDTLTITAANAGTGANALVLCGIEWQEVR